MTDLYLPLAFRSRYRQFPDGHLRLTVSRRVHVLGSCHWLEPDTLVV
jgi:hypothetical protein